MLWFFLKLKVKGNWDPNRVQYIFSAKQTFAGLGKPYFLIAFLTVGVNDTDEVCKCLQRVQENDKIGCAASRRACSFK
jgi:hypothetical protein